MRPACGVALREFVSSAWAGHRAETPAPLRLTACNRATNSSNSIAVASRLRLCYQFDNLAQQPALQTGANSSRWRDTPRFFPVFQCSRRDSQPPRQVATQYHVSLFLHVRLPTRAKKKPGQTCCLSGLSIEVTRESKIMFPIVYASAKRTSTSASGAKRRIVERANLAFYANTLPAALFSSANRLSIQG